MIVLLLFTICTTGVFAESFRLGVQGGVELLNLYNQPPPATQFDAYPLKNFHFAFFGGLSF